MGNTGDELWQKVQQELQAKLSKPTFETFIRPTGCSGFADGELKLMAPNPFAGVRLKEQLLPTIAELAAGVCGRPVQVTVLAESAVPAGMERDRQAPPHTSDSAAPPVASSPVGAPPERTTPRRYLPGLNPRYVFNRFVVGPNSRMAHAAAVSYTHLTLPTNQCV